MKKFHLMTTGHGHVKSAAPAIKRVEHSSDGIGYSAIFDQGGQGAADSGHGHIELY